MQWKKESIKLKIQITLIKLLQRKTLTDCMKKLTRPYANKYNNNWSIVRVQSKILYNILNVKFLEYIILKNYSKKSRNKIKQNR